MGLLNYSTRIEAEKTAGEVVAILAHHGATAIGMDYDGHGNVLSVSWKVNTPQGILPFKLPVNERAVASVLERQHYSGQLPRAALAEGQARRTAWRILKNWIRAQMALLETEMVTLDQLFFPYLLTGPGETLYERLATGKGLKSLTEGVNDHA